ncbi:hypothetical protein ACVWWG_005003 [Bradyrhizobium sp. LB7.2]
MYILTCRHSFAPSRRFSPELCLVASPSCPRGRREGRVPAGTRGPLREDVAQGNRTAAYRCSPITRPSLRSGFTAYAVLSREPSSFWPPSPSRKSRTPRRLTRMPHPQKLDRSNDGQDHTVLPYARFACRHRFRRRCARCRRPDDETNLTAPLVGTKFWAHGEQSALPALSHPTLSRPPQARLYDHHDTWSPLKGEPGWATHTPKPNFGKAEYFRAGGLTGGDTDAVAAEIQELPWLICNGSPRSKAGQNKLPFRPRTALTTP